MSILKIHRLLNVTTERKGYRKPYIVCALYLRASALALRATLVFASFLEIVGGLPGLCGFAVLIVSHSAANASLHFEFLLV